MGGGTYRLFKCTSVQKVDTNNRKVDTHLQKVDKGVFYS